MQWLVRRVLWQSELLVSKCLQIVAKKLMDFSTSVKLVGHTTPGKSHLLMEYIV